MKYVGPPLSALLLGAACAASFAAETSVTLWAAGDIAQCGNDGAGQTGDFLARRKGPILALGDLAYPKGSQADFEKCFAPRWGKLNSRLIPVPGNHEYATPGATGYYDYFGSVAGNPGEGWHSRNLGAWHLVGLNSTLQGTLAEAQLKWLENDLASHGKSCILAFFHHPRYSSGHHGDQTAVDALWRILSRFRTTLVLAGHDHHYERFAARNADGQADPQGIRSFVVGTGGAHLYGLGSPQATSEYRDNQHWGVLRLDLDAGRYRWQFHPVNENAPTDQGEGNCIRRNG